MKYFVLNHAPTGKHEVARVDVLAADGTIYGDAPRCDACGKYIGMREWLPPYRVELDTWGREYGDLAFIGVGSEVLVSRRFVELWKREGLVGLNGYEPVEIVKIRHHRKLRGDPPQYFRALATRGRAVMDQAASGFEWEEAPTCVVCQLGHLIKRWERVIIDEATWSGEDFFVPRGLATLITTERFKRFCEADNIKNAVFIPAEEYGHDFYPWERTGEGRRESHG
jgi:hypothetical protein